MEFYITEEIVKGRKVRYLTIDVNLDGDYIAVKVGYVDRFNRVYLFKK